MNAPEYSPRANVVRGWPPKADLFGCDTQHQYLARSASARRPASGDPHPRDLDPMLARDHALGRHAREPGVDDLDHLPVLKPCASIIASVQPSRQEASNSRARRRVGLGMMCLRLSIP
jgi:hypothetical protein